MLIDTGPLQFHWLQLWLPHVHASAAWLDVGIFMDTRGVGEFLCVLVISLLAHVYLLSLLKAPEIRSTFFAWCDITVLSLLLAVISPNLMQWYACLAIASASAWFMLNTVWRAPHEHNAWKWIIAPILSDAFFLMGIFIVILHFGTAGLSIIANNSYPPGTGSNFESKPISDGLGWYDCMGLCFVAGALGRAALFPFHTWLMRLAPAASPVIAIFAPSAVIACGPFLLFRMSPLFSSNVELAILLCGNLSILIGSLTALVQTNIKQVVFSIMIAQTGVCFVLLGSGAMDLALAAGIVMAIAVTGMLFTTGAVLASTQGRDDLRTMGGLWRSLPITALTSL
ncbi:MAG TPA: proton-conducting transporter membrane subunit, partial [Phycisphaerae bacterium]|nr:proton-conducting transporter membrane subunit [Phycisphaerae bacterium]